VSGSSDHDVVSESGLEALVRRAGGFSRGPAPVEKWNPDYCGEIDIRIVRDGTWFYMGTPIGRENLVKLFASVLRRDEDHRYYLVTPVERIGITVEDAPFVAIEMDVSGTGSDQALTLRTNVGDVVQVSSSHRLRFEQEDHSGGLKPYVHVRGRLEALLSRPLLYQLAEIGTDEVIAGDRWFGVHSAGDFFPAILSAELERLSR
jgi:hypothetical protein